MAIPQIAAIVWLTLMFAVGALCHGKATKTSFWGMVIGISIWLAILIPGGFFD